VFEEKIYQGGIGASQVIEIVTVLFMRVVREAKTKRKKSDIMYYNEYTRFERYVMNKTSVVSARITPETKNGAEMVLKRLGLSTTDAITMLFQQITLRQGIPFPVEIPNAETMKAISDPDARIDVCVANSMEELREQLGGC
jgi:DNA-damage-inducible protein J